MLTPTERKTADCPRCGGGIPNDAMRGEYSGALSRYDNEIEICSSCGTEEALMGGHLVPFEIPLYSPEAGAIRAGAASV